MNDLVYLFFGLLHKLIQAIQPVLVPICFVVGWATIAIGAWSLWSAARDSFRRARRMHEIPCADCQYFSGNYVLKCPLHPKEALSEAAIACRDFESTKLEVPAKG